MVAACIVADIATFDVLVDVVVVDGFAALPLLDVGHFEGSLLNGKL